MKKPQKRRRKQKKGDKNDDGPLPFADDNHNDDANFDEDDNTSIHSSINGAPNYRDLSDDHSASEEETPEQIQARLEKEFLQKYLQETKEGRKRAKTSLNAGGDSDTDDEDEESRERKRRKTTKKKEKQRKGVVIQEDKKQNEIVSAESEDEDDGEARTERFIKERIEEDRVFRSLASSLRPLESIQSDCLVLRNGHRNSLTGVVISHSGKYVYSGDRDGTIIKWCLSSGRRLHTAPCGQRKSIHPWHTCSITGLDCTRDDLLLVSADATGRILVWETETMNKRQKELKKSRFPVTALKCHRYEQVAYSGHSNGAIFIWSLPLGSALQELWDHDGPITCLDVCDPDRLVSSSNDARLVHWKITENTFGTFKHKDRPVLSVECVTKVANKVLVSGDTENTLSVWHIHRATARQIIPAAHPASQSNQWIGSITSVHNSDLIVSGAGNGEIRVWQLKLDGQLVSRPILVEDLNVSLQHVLSIPQPGYINALSISDDGRYLAVAVGRDYRQTRILPTQKGIRPHIYIYHLLNKE